MKTTLLSLAVAAALSATSFAHAADAGESVKINAPAGYHIEPQQFADYEYAYQLSNGDQVRFTRKVGVFYTAVKGSPKVRIFPTGPGQFVTSSGTKMTFTEDGDTVTINNYERLPMASRLPANTIVVATR
jgi:hypothetical protein